MKIYCNRLPIHFGEQGIPCRHHGYKADLAPHTSFEWRGNFLEWYTDENDALTDAKAEWIPATDLDGHVQPYLLSLVGKLLANTGEVEHKGDWLLYTSLGQATELTVELDLAQAQIGLLLSPLPNGTLPTQTNLSAVISALSGMKLTTFATVGCWAPIKTEACTLPDLIFREDGTQHHSVAAEGIRKFGPLSRKSPSLARPIHIIWIARKQQSASMSNFLSDFEKGMNGAHDATQHWPQGWAETFHLRGGVHLHRLEMADYNQNGLKDLLAAKMDAMNAEGNSPDLILYEKEEIHPRLEIFCLRRPIACHWIPTADFVSRGPARAKVLETLGLILYAKLGGTPWLLPLPRTLHRQYVVGIGSIDQERGILGYATVFGAQGNYQLGEARWEQNAESWSASLSEFVTNRIRHLLHDGEYQQGDQIDLIFHLDRPWQDSQRTAIREALQDQLGGKFILKTSFVHLGWEHPYHLWDNAGKPLPPCTLHALDDRRKLMQLADIPDGEKPSRPILATLLDGSECGDFGFLCYQIHTFASLSWTGVHRTALPASLLYGQRIAAKFAALSRENTDLHIPDDFKSIPWYL